MADRLAEIKERREGITNPPWKRDMNRVEQRDPWPPGFDHRPTSIAYLHMTRGNYQAEERNAEFIANAPDDIDWLVAKVEDLESELQGRDHMLEAMGRKYGFHLE